MLLEILSGNVATVVEVSNTQPTPGQASIRVGAVDTEPNKPGIFIQTGLGDGTGMAMFLKDGTNTQQVTVP